MDNTQTVIADKINQLTKEQRMTRGQLAEMSFIPRTTLDRKLDAGGTALTLDELRRIGQALGVKVAELIPEQVNADA